MGRFKFGVTNVKSIDSERNKVLGISSNSDSTYYLLNKGLYFQGQDRLGLRDIEQITRNYPLKMHIPSPLTKVLGVNCGEEHVFAWTSEGTVYTWGVNNDCCLGVIDNYSRRDCKIRKPELVEILKNAKIVACLAVKDSSLALDYRGRVYNWGKTWNDLNHNEVYSHAQELSFQQSPKPVIAKMVSSLGSFGFLSSTGHVYTCGSK